VGLGALFFAPNRRFMMAAAWGVFGSRSGCAAGFDMGCVQDGISWIVRLRGMLVGFVRERWLCLYGGVVCVCIGNWWALEVEVGVHVTRLPRQH
jgi:hypothetical protein